MLAFTTTAEKDVQTAESGDCVRDSGLALADDSIESRELATHAPHHLNSCAREMLTPPIQFPNPEFLRPAMALGFFHELREVLCPRRFASRVQI